MLPSEAFNASHYKITAKVLSALLAEQHLQTEIWGQRAQRAEDALNEEMIRHAPEDPQGAEEGRPVEEAP